MHTKKKPIKEKAAWWKGYHEVQECDKYIEDMSNLWLFYQEMSSIEKMQLKYQSEANKGQNPISSLQ